MAYNESSYEASKRYKASKIKRVPLDMQIADYEALQMVANKTGEKVNTYIKKAIAQRMENMGCPGYGISQTESVHNETSRSISHTESLFTESEIKEITALLKDGQTVEEYIRTSVLDRLRIDTAKANS